MSSGALTEITLCLSWAMESMDEPPLTSSVSTLGCRKEASAMMRSLAVPASSLSM